MVVQNPCTAFIHSLCSTMFFISYGQTDRCMYPALEPHSIMHAMRCHRHPIHTALHTTYVHATPPWMRLKSVSQLYSYLSCYRHAHRQATQRAPTYPIIHHGDWKTSAPSQSPPGVNPTPLLIMPSSVLHLVHCHLPSGPAEHSRH